MLCEDQRDLSYLRQTYFDAYFSWKIFCTIYIWSWFFSEKYFHENKSNKRRVFTKIIRNRYDIVTRDNTLDSVSEHFFSLLNVQQKVIPFDTAYKRNPSQYKNWTKWKCNYLPISAAQPIPRKSTSTYFRNACTLHTRSYASNQTYKKIVCTNERVASGDGNSCIRFWCMDYGWCILLSCRFHNYFSVVFNQVRCQLDSIGFSFFSVSLSLGSISFILLRYVHSVAIFFSNEIHFFLSIELTQVMNRIHEM